MTKVKINFRWPRMIIKADAKTLCLTFTWLASSSITLRDAETQLHNQALSFGIVTTVLIRWWWSPSPFFSFMCWSSWQVTFCSDGYTQSDKIRAHTIFGDELAHVTLISCCFTIAEKSLIVRTFFDERPFAVFVFLLMTLKSPPTFQFDDEQFCLYYNRAWGKWLWLCES